MIDRFIHDINEYLEGLFTTWPDAVLYGLSESVIRVKGTEQELLPCTVETDGEGNYIGIDDVFSVMLYHKLNSLTSQVRASGSYGDSLGNIVNTYQLGMIVFLDRRKTGLRPEELLLYIQSNFPDRLSSDSFKNNIVRFTGAVLNSRAVFGREYQGTAFRLPPEKSVFEITYSIESIFSKGCFNKCPC